MENKRRYKRIIFSNLLDVLDVRSKQLLGQILDITIEGFQLMSQKPIEQDSTFTVKIDLPEIIGDLNYIKLSVKKVWQTEDMGLYYSGFHIERASLETIETIQTLIAKYGTN